MWLCTLSPHSPLGRFTVNLSTQGESILSGIAHWTLAHEYRTPSVIDLTNAIYYTDTEGCEFPNFGAIPDPFCHTL